MSSIYNQFGQYSTSKASITNQNSGFVLGKGSDAIGARDIGNIGNNFANTVTTVTSPSPYRVASGDAKIYNNIDALGIQKVTPTKLKTTTNFAPNGLVRLQTSEFPFFQSVPEMGKNPDALTILSASTQFQADLQTVGPRAIPGFPVVDLGNNPDAMDAMGYTQSFMNSLVPFYPLADLSGAYFPGSDGGGYYYAPPTVHPDYDYGPFAATGYKQFTPVTITPNTGTSTGTSTSGTIAVDSNRISSTAAPRFSNVISSYNGYPLSYSAYPGLAESMNGGYSNGIRTKSQKKNTPNKGKYNQGTVNSPFGDNFIKQATAAGGNVNGTGVTPVNTKGFFKGSSRADTIRTNSIQPATVDGQGGSDTIYTGNAGDTVNVHQGDKVSTAGGSDILYFNFTEQAMNNNLTVIDGGSSSDTLVMTVPGDPTDPDNIPTFSKQSDGSLKISLNGIQIQTRNVESFIVVDRKGNIGLAYNATTGQSITG